MPNMTIIVRNASKALSFLMTSFIADPFYQNPCPSYNGKMKRRQILGVRVDIGLGADETVKVVEELMLKDGDSHYICTTNPEFIMEAQKDGEFKKIINDSYFIKKLNFYLEIIF